VRSVDDDDGRVVLIPGRRESGPASSIERNEDVRSMLRLRRWSRFRHARRNHAVHESRRARGIDHCVDRRFRTDGLFQFVRPLLRRVLGAAVVSDHEDARLFTLSARERNVRAVECIGLELRKHLGRGSARRCAKQRGRAGERDEVAKAVPDLHERCFANVRGPSAPVRSAKHTPSVAGIGNMKRGNVARLALGLGAVGAFLVTRARRRRRSVQRVRHANEGGAGSYSLDAANLVVVRGSRAVIAIDVSSTGRIEVAGSDARPLEDIVTISREDEGSQVALDLAPRSTIRVSVPPNCALRVAAVRSCVRVTGLDDVSVECSRSSVSLRDVAGTVAVDLVRAAVNVELSRNRHTHSVDLLATRSALRLALPADAGGSYRIREVRSSVVHPESIENGIPIAVQAERASVAIRAA